MTSYFDALGAHLEKTWSRVDRDEAVFSDIATEALERFPPGKLDLDAWITRQLDPSVPVGRQLVPLGVFGQPGFTAFYGRNFVVDLYFWTHSESAIHDHPFSGAFTVLEGHSVHAVYSFTEEQRVSERLRLGVLRQTRLETVRPGSVHAFGPARAGLVHALIHVPVPSVSMVVRTVRTDGYMRYLPPGIAIAMHPADESFERPLSLLDTLRVGGDPRFTKRLETWLEGADLEATFHALSRFWYTLAHDARAPLVEAARARHGEPVERLVAAVVEGGVAHGAQAIRAAMRAPDDRFVATGLALAETREHLLDLLRTVHEDPVGRLHRFIDETGIFEEDELASAHIAHALVDGEGIEGAVSRLVDLYGESAIAEQLHAIQSYAAEGPFARLAR